jgi:histidinol-phosphate aminotransferase
VSIESLARPEIVAMKPYSSARKEAPGRGILLNANESPWPLLGGDDLNRYPEPQPGELVTRLAKLYGVAENCVLVTRGSDEGIDLLTRVFCRAGEDAILHCPPTFGMYRIAAQTQGADIVEVPRSRESDFALDVDGVLRALGTDPRIRLVFLTSPNNPTGDVIEPSSLSRILAGTAGRALLVVDEAYAEYCSQPSAAGLIEQHEHLVVLRTLSKAWAGAGLRCGTVLAQEAVIALLRRIIAPYPLAAPVTSLANRMLEGDIMRRQQEMLQAIRDNKRRLVKLLTDRPSVVNIWPGEANFVLLNVLKPGELLSFCAARGVILRGYRNDPSLSDCIRISVGSDEDLDALEAALNAWEEAQS